MLRISPLANSFCDSPSQTKVRKEILPPNKNQRGGHTTLTLWLWTHSLCKNSSSRWWIRDEFAYFFFRAAAAAAPVLVCREAKASLSLFWEIKITRELCVLWWRLLNDIFSVYTCMHVLQYACMMYFVSAGRRAGWMLNTYMHARAALGT